MSIVCEGETEINDQNNMAFLNIGSYEIGEDSEGQYLYAPAENYIVRPP